MKPYAYFIIVIAGILTGCSDRNGKEACRILASVRDESGHLVFKGEELHQKMMEAEKLSAQSSTPKLSNSYNEMIRARGTNDAEVFLKASDAWIASCNEFFPIPPIDRSDSN